MIWQGWFGWQGWSFTQEVGEGEAFDDDPPRGSEDVGRPVGKGMGTYGSPGLGTQTQ